jgi:hypothetical protein
MTRSWTVLMLMNELPNIVIFYVTSFGWLICPGKIIEYSQLIASRYISPPKIVLFRNVKYTFTPISRETNRRTRQQRQPLHQTPHPMTTRMRSAQYTSIQSMTKAKWRNEWTTGRESARRLENLSQYPDTTTGPKLYRTLQGRKHVT